MSPDAFLLVLFFDPKNGSFLLLQDVISQKTVLFIATSVRTSNPEIIS
jgi:hypothetical protein